MKSDSDKLTRLLIVDEGLHQAEIITSALRSFGLHVLAEFAEDSTDMNEIISNKTLDLVLLSLDLPDFDLQQVQNLIKECGRHISVIGMSSSITEETTLTAMKQGAADVVNSSSLELMALIVKREATNLKVWRKAVASEKELHESEKRCQSLLANSKDAVAYVHEGMHIYANEVYLDLFGNTDFDELEGIPLIDMVHASQQDELKQFLRDLSQNKNTRNELKLKLVRQGSEIIEGLLEFSRASYEGEPCMQILIRSDDDTSELEEQINYLHKHDLVSNLFNRQYFMEKLQQRIHEAVSGDSISVLLFISIDNFQYVRERVGISGCDILINDIAIILTQYCRENELVARFGAYSYTILYTGKKKNDVAGDSEALLKQIEQHISEIGNQSISATCSISIYNIDQNSLQNPNEIIARSEKNLDKIQAEGGNKADVYVPIAGEMSQEEEDGEIVKYIKSAIANDTLIGLYQPIVSISGAHGERYEIIKKIPKEDGEVLTEDDFMSTAERTGTAKTLDRWAIITAIKQIAQATESNRKLEIFVPLSCDSIQDASLARWVSARIQSAKIPGEQIGFLINESHAVNQLKSTKNLYKGLKQLHCQIILDGFGTGLNPFHLVKHIPPDFLRINLAYVEGLASNTDNQKSIREISNQASSMEIRCIIPGVNDASVLSVLWTVGADFVQGEFLQQASEYLNYDFSSMSL